MMNNQNSANTKNSESNPDCRGIGFKKKIYWLPVLIIAAVFLYLAFEKADFAAMKSILARGNYVFMVFASFFLTFSYYVRGLRWRLLFDSEKMVTPLTAFWATMTGYLGNNLLPARAGELLRTAVLSGKTGTSRTYIVGTIITERTVEAIIAGIIGLVLLLTFTFMPVWIRDIMVLTVTAGLLFAGLFIILFFNRKISLKILKKLPAADSFTEKIMPFAQMLVQGIAAVRYPGRAGLFIVFTGLIWFLEICWAKSIAVSLHLSIDSFQLLLLLVCLALAGIIPSTPGYVGIYQYVAVAVLVPFGFSDNEALVYILTFQIVAYVIVIFWGFMGLWRMNAWNSVKIRP